MPLAEKNCINLFISTRLKKVSTIWVLKTDYSVKVAYWLT